MPELPDDPNELDDTPSGGGGIGDRIVQDQENSDQDQSQGSNLNRLDDLNNIRDKLSDGGEATPESGGVAASGEPAMGSGGVGAGEAASGSEGVTFGAGAGGGGAASAEMGGAGAATATGAAGAAAGAGEAAAGGVAAAAPAATGGAGVTFLSGPAAPVTATVTAVAAVATTNRGRKILMAVGGGILGCLALPLLVIFMVIFIFIFPFMSGGTNSAEASNSGGTSNLLSISKTVTPNIIPKDTANASVTYTIRVINNSSADATGVTVTDKFGSSPPETASFVTELTGYEATYSIGNLAAGASNVKTFTITIPHTNFDPGWLLINTSQVSGTINGKTESSSSTANVVIGKPVSVPPVGCPMIGNITTPYGSNIPGYVQNPDGSILRHDGIDIGNGVKDNSPVYATMTGTLSYYDYFSALGGSMTRTMKINNGIYQVQYFHVVAGTRAPEGPVIIGQKIGNEDETGYVFGEHLHYEVRINDSRVDPSPFLGATLYYTQPANDDFTGMTELNPWGKCENLPQSPVVVEPPPNPASPFFVFSDAGQKPWTQAEKDMVNQAIITPTTSTTWKNWVFAAGKVTVLRSPVDPSCPDVCSGFAQDANTLVLRDKFFTLTDPGKVFVITHELTHILQNRNPQIMDTFKASTAYQEYLAKGVIASYPLCSGFTCPGQPDLSPLNEDFAEMAGNYVSDRDGYPLDFPTEYPEHFKFARDTLFGGTSF